MQSKRSKKDYLFLVLKGLAMGAANKVPGVSGGLVAFVAGFYQEFIYSLQRFNKTAIKLVLGGRFKSCFDYINGRFLCYLISGMIISYFSISKFFGFSTYTLRNPSLEFIFWNGNWIHLVHIQ